MSNAAGHATGMFCHMEQKISHQVRPLTDTHRLVGDDAADVGADTNTLSLPKERTRFVQAAIRRLISARADNPASSTPEPEAVIAVVGRLARSFKLGSRQRFVINQAIGQVSVYLALFAPPAGPAAAWKAEMGIDGVVTWMTVSGQRVFSDLVSVVGPTASVWTSGSKRRSWRVLEQGHTRFGDRFEGVRVIALSAPGKSLWVVSRTEPASLLSATDLWFTGRVVTGDVLLTRVARSA